MYVHNTYVLERDMNMYVCPILQHTFHLWEYARMDGHTNYENKENWSYLEKLLENFLQILTN